MKKIIILPLIIFLFINQLSAQTKDDYFIKSKRQKTAAWVLIIGGGAVGLINAVIATQGITDLATGQFEEANKKLGVSGILDIVGLTAMLGSVPFFIASSKNKRKAKTMTITFSPQPSPTVLQHITGTTFIPSISLKFGL
ncbi:MAG: hypothetical protein ABIR31_03300 [Ginsengibacter sp.]